VSKNYIILTTLSLHTVSSTVARFCCCYYGASCEQAKTCVHGACSCAVLLLFFIQLLRLCLIRDTIDVMNNCCVYCKTTSLVECFFFGCSKLSGLNGDDKVLC
jgi:hypothetical protein